MGLSFRADDEGYSGTNRPRRRRRNAAAALVFVLFTAVLQNLLRPGWDRLPGALAKDKEVLILPGHATGKATGEVAEPEEQGKGEEEGEGQGRKTVVSLDGEDDSFRAESLQVGGDVCCGVNKCFSS